MFGNDILRISSQNDFGVLNDTACLLETILNVFDIILLMQIRYLVAYHVPLPIPTEGLMSWYPLLSAA